MEKITVWETFFMLLTVIPVSKMLSSIFMKLVARVGTVDEDKWAMIGLGAIGATFGVMKGKGMLGAQVPPVSFRGTGGMGGAGGSPSMGAGGMGGSNGGSGMGGAGAGGSSDMGNSPNPRGVDNMNNPNMASNMGTLNSNSPNTDFSAGNQSPSGVAGTTGGPSVNSGVGAMQANKNIGNNVPAKGQRSLDDIIHQSGAIGDKAAGTMAKFGAASSFAVPNAAPAVAGIYAATGKATTGFASTAHNLSQEIKARKNNGQNFWQAMQDISGSSNKVEATTRVASAMLLSPLGSRAASFGSHKAGSLANWSSKKFWGE